ncbi:MAG: molybdopterin-binding protein [Lachnospiraceae bacterium]|nr:molybdopterin-binding protein [Lachnospiraceae bacterium]
MKKVLTTEAVGMTLCHDVTGIGKDFKGPVFRRGHVIREEDVERLLDLGKRHVFIWEENAGEIHEEDAALRLAALTQTDHASFTGPSEGKMVLTADCPGQLRVNVALLNAVNSIGDITISTLPDHYPCHAGSKLAAMRIVPLVTQEAQIIEAERLCAEADVPLLRYLTYQKKKAGIIITGSEIYSGRIPDLFEPVIRRKLAPYDAEVLGCTFCDDDLDMIRGAIEAYLAQGADLLIMTGGMSVDPDDLTPTAVREAGAEIVSHGVPSQPGNMLMVAYIGDVPVLGVPGAAVKLPTTTFDVILPQIMTGERVTKEDLVRLGDGGFCQSCGDACHWPNCTFGRY